MVFSSLLFLYAFLPFSLVAYYFCRNLRAKNICLLIFSLIFYTWGEPKYVLLLLVMSAFDWAFALGIERNRRYKRLYLLLACAVNIGLIGLFKYGKMLCSAFGSTPDFISKITLPLGISFYTFQLLTYVVDVYRGEAHAEKKYWHVLLYAALFHQCIAGPIVRYNSIAEELFVSRDGGTEMPDGIQRFAVGLAKKVILANSCGAVAETFLLADSAIEDAAAFTQNVSQLSGTPVLALWIGAICYALQIYYDFSAYSDMAIGMGKMLGLHYPENFNYPYISGSVTEFWRRWHISLSTFFRDYVYIPLGGNRKGGVRTVVNLFIVWALTGLWHGASLNFVLWGLYFFVFLIIEKPILRNRAGQGRNSSPLSHLYLIIVVLFGWILFRYTDMRYIPVVLKGMFGLNGNSFSNFETITIVKNNMFFIGFCLIAATPIIKIAFEFVRGGLARSRAGLALANAVRYAIIPVLLLLLSTAALVGASYNPFLYYRF